VPNLIAVAEAVGVYGLNRATLQRAMRAGRLTVYDGGLGDRRVYLDRDELDEIVKPKARPPRKKGASK